MPSVLIYAIPYNSHAVNYMQGDSLTESRHFILLFYNWTGFIKRHLFTSEGAVHSWLRSTTFSFRMLDLTKYKWLLTLPIKRNFN